LIPKSIKKLTFENRYSQLKGTIERDEEPGIGKYSFKKSPFLEVEFPLGLGYDIGEGAFESSDIVSFVMPTPKLATKDDIETQDPYHKCEIGEWMLFTQEIGVIG